MLSIWLMACLLGVVLCISGAVMLFPNFEQGRALMQAANVVHIVCAMVMIFLASFHIYLGTIGTKGAYEGMRTGYVDETWAKEHHDLWLQDQLAKGRSADHPELPSATPAE
jgi:formate dehydrogenase subunit gamma